MAAAYMQRETKRQRLKRELAAERVGLPLPPDSQLQQHVTAQQATFGTSASSEADSDSETGNQQGPKHDKAVAMPESAAEASLER